MHLAASFSCLDINSLSYDRLCTDCVMVTAACNLPPGTLVYNHQSELFNLHFKVSSLHFKYVQCVIIPLHTYLARMCDSIQATSGHKESDHS